MTDKGNPDFRWRERACCACVRACGVIACSEGHIWNKGGDIWSFMKCVGCNSRRGNVCRGRSGSGSACARREAVEDPLPQTADSAALVTLNAQLLEEKTRIKRWGVRALRWIAATPAKTTQFACVCEVVGAIAAVFALGSTRRARPRRVRGGCPRSRSALSERNLPQGSPQNS